MNKRQLVIVVMATFCLTTLLMMPLVRSTGEPDPWADVSGPIVGVPDGIVNMRDVAYEIVHFNENVTGIPREVNVTNWPTMQPEPAYRIVKMPVYNMSWTSGIAFFSLDAIYVGGFGKAFVLIEPVPAGVSSEGSYTVSVKLEDIYWVLDPSTQSLAAQGPFPYNGPQSPVTDIFVVNGQVIAYGTPNWSENSYLGIKAPYMQLLLKGNATTSAGWLNIQVIVYLRND